MYTLRSESTLDSQTSHNGYAESVRENASWVSSFKISQQIEWWDQIDEYPQSQSSSPLHHQTKRQFSSYGFHYYPPHYYLGDLVGVLLPKRIKHPSTVSCTSINLASTHNPQHESSSPRSSHQFQPLPNPTSHFPFHPHHHIYNIANKTPTAPTITALKLNPF